MLYPLVSLPLTPAEFVSHTKNKSRLIADVRPSELSESRTKLATVLNAAVETLEAQHQVFPDIVVLLSAHSPLRKPHHITKAIDTLNLYNVDNVISTYEDIELHFVHTTYIKGLNTPLYVKI